MHDFIQYISINSEIRIAVVDILQWLASGMSVQEVLEDFPSLKEEHIRASLAFASHREMFIKSLAA